MSSEYSKLSLKEINEEARALRESVIEHAVNETRSADRETVIKFLKGYMREKREEGIKSYIDQGHTEKEAIVFQKVIMKAIKEGINWLEELDEKGDYEFGDGDLKAIKRLTCGEEEEMTR